MHFILKTKKAKIISTDFKGVNWIYRSYLSLVEKGGSASFEPLLSILSQWCGRKKANSMMILKSFSWQHFMLAAGVLGVLWYLGIWWYYRSKGDAPPLDHRWKDKVDELKITGDPDLMGEAALEDGVMVLEADQFGFADRPKADALPDRSDQLGLVADAQQEIKSVCAILAEKDGNKDDFFAMMDMVKAKYPKINGHPASAELGAFIREHVPFHLSGEELEDLWS